MKTYYLTSLLLLFLFSCSQNKAKKEKVVINPYYDQAFEFLEKKIPDSAFRYFNKAKDLFSQQKDSLGIAKCLINMAMISIDKGDYFGGQEISLEALAYFNLNEKKQFVYLESNYHELALASSLLKDYKQAIIFYNQSLKYAQDSLSVLTTRNNLANAYSNQKEYSKSQAIYEQILQKKIISPRNYAMTLTNMASSKWEQDEKYNAAPELLRALQIRKKENDKWGLNSSYANLADFYVKSDLDSALFYAIKMYHTAQVIESPDDQLSALQMLIKLSPAKETKGFFSIYEKLNDSLQTARSAAKNQFALIRYETEKSKADYLKSQAENLRKNKDIILRNIGISALLTCLILGFIFYRKRRNELRKEKELEVKKTELKYVKKVHDEVANKIYQMMTEVENDPQMDRIEVADQLEIVYNISRNILYQNTNINIKESFFRDVNKMLYAYSSDKIEVVVKGSDEKLWEKVEESTKYEVYYILQNLMTNMSKHSGADYVSIEFAQKNSVISIMYFDNGKGMQGALKKNGLTNTENRIENISGSITFDTKPDAGLEIKLSFPI
ncbi:ATP-binding protein [Pedobacter terrae]|uniref:ATP-binding protein n=1 Tax=Pedobacter terrae TaxID=405671 RepID=UPI002FF66493